MARECHALAQDSPHVLLFFTLKNVFRELAEALEGGAIEVARHEELVRGFSERVLSLLQKIMSGQTVARTRSRIWSGRIS